MKRDKFIIGTRGSKLALIYTEKVINALKNVSPTQVETKKIVTSGDENQKDRLSNIGGKGLFSKKIETELINQSIDIAVHALKDMPSIETDGLITNFYLKRNSPNEIFISNNNIKFQDLKPNSTIGTSSYRREVHSIKKLPSGVRSRVGRRDKIPNPQAEEVTPKPRSPTKDF